MRWQFSDWNCKPHALEAFNGQYFFNLPDGKNRGGEEKGECANEMWMAAA